MCEAGEVVEVPEDENRAVRGADYCEGDGCFLWDDLGEERWIEGWVEADFLDVSDRERTCGRR